MTAAGIDLAMARREAESEMREKCRITRPGEKVWNPTTLQYDTPTTVVYAGKCKLRLGAVRVRRGQAAGQVFAEQSATVSLPVTRSSGIRKDDRVEVTESADDPEMVGVVVWVDANRAMSNSTARRFPVRETQ